MHQTKQKNRTMRKVLSLIMVAGIFAITSCGPSAEEKAATEKAAADSVAAAEAQMKAAEEAAMAAAAAASTTPDSGATATDSTAHEGHSH